MDNNIFRQAFMCLPNKIAQLYLYIENSYLTSSEAEYVYWTFNPGDFMQVRVRQVELILIFLLKKEKNTTLQH